MSARWGPRPSHRSFTGLVRLSPRGPEASKPAVLSPSARPDLDRADPTWRGSPGSSARVPLHAVSARARRASPWTGLIQSNSTSLHFRFLVSALLAPPASGSQGLKREPDAGLSFLPSCSHLSSLEPGFGPPRYTENILMRMIRGLPGTKFHP